MVDPKRPAAYERLYAQLEPLIRDKSPTLTAGMATIAALLHAKLKHHSWTGFYFMAGDDELHMGPYQGPVACQVLKGRGVCLAAFDDDDIEPLEKILGLLEPLLVVPAHRGPRL